MTTNDPSPLTDQPAIQPEFQPELGEPIVPSPRPQQDRWVELLKAFGAWIGSVVFLLFIPLILVLPYFVYLAVSSHVPLGEGLAQDKTFLLLSIIGVLPAHLLTWLLAWVLVTNWRKRSFSQVLGLSWPETIPAWAGYGICLLLSLLLLGMGMLITHFLGGGKTDLDRLIESSYQARVATAIVAVVTAPFVEEVIYRGMLYPAIEKIIGMGGAIAIVSIMFAGVHVLQYWNNIGVIVAITILSITLTMIRAFSGKLLPAVVVHVIFNGLQSLYLVLEPFLNKTDKVEPAPALTQLSRILSHLF